MTGIVVMEFSESKVSQNGDAIYPPNVTTRGSTPLSVTLSKSTFSVVVTSDANARMTWDGTGPAASDIPILSAVPNQFMVGAASPPTLKFT